MMSLHGEAPVTFVLLLLMVTTSIYALRNKTAYYRLLLHPYSISKKNQYYRLFTSDFVHNDLMHLVLNGLMLYVFGANLEEFLNNRSAWGSLQLLVIYMVSLLTGTIITTIRHRNDFYYSSAGASGSILGCMFAFILVDHSYVPLYLPVIGGVNNLYSGLIYIALLIFYQKKQGSSINHELHILGALGGIMATLIMFPGLL